MPMRDAAQVACVSKAFVRSWRCHPNLDFHEKTLGLNFNTLVDRIMKNHSCIGVKSLKFHFPKALVSNKGSCRLDGLESLLLSIVKPGIKELSLNLTVDGNYKFPCSLLSDGNGDQLRCLFLACCHFRPTVAFGCLRSLTKLQLTMVHITASELGCLLFGSFALEHLELRYCSEIVRLKIPFLKQLSHLGVVHCNRLRAIESKAPNLSSICFIGDLKVQLLLAKACHIKKLDSSCNNFAFYARTELPSSMPNLEALTINSYSEMVSTPMAPSRFLHLSFLRVALGGLNFDYLSLISFLDASPSLETFILEERKVRLLVFEDLSDLRILPKHHYSKLKVVKIIKFSSAKSVVELTCHILESTPSLKRLTLDTTHGLQRCSVSKSGKCIFMLKDALAEAHRGLLAAQTYIKPKVPSTVELNVLEPCSQCHAVGL
ncbi:hypothetical protein PR202_ga02604 [Eleusine coracana subsp. coracana]|uniref:At1g61320/AtMIF1 LRR domain-containing protein n=1 Tax=Eleusine coracana subsp. coracana TaxID=191504 RepID=A0AAV5BLA5_ELECO|nr:hypothetical protein PR202_ga02604 [Eleusine coracana subsp. coracana]